MSDRYTLSYAAMCISQVLYHMSIMGGNGRELTGAIEMAQEHIRGVVEELPPPLNRDEIYTFVDDEIILWDAMMLVSCAARNTMDYMRAELLLEAQEYLDEWLRRANHE